MNKKRILFVIYSIYGGGAEKQVQYLLKYIDRKKFELHLCVFHLTGKEKEVVPGDVTIYDLKTRFRPASLFLVFKLLKLTNKIKPDRILCSLWGVNLISIVAGMLTKTKVFAVEQIFTPMDMQEYSFIKIRKIIVSLLYKKTQKVIAVSKDVMNGLVDYFFLPPEKIAIIHNMVDFEKIEKLSMEYVPTYKDYIFTCGRLEKQKNHIFLIESVSGISNIQVIILGEGSERNFLEHEAKELKVNLFLSGYLNNPYPYFKQAKVFVLTSKYEGFPNVVLEAMVCKVPVVAVDCPGGINEIIEDRRTGLLIPTGDKKALANAIGELINNDNLCKMLTVNAYEKVKEKFSIERMIKSYENILQ